MPRKSKKQLQEEAKELINQAVMVLDSITNDTSVPRNIRRITAQATEEIKSPDNTPAVNASNAISLLDDLSQDPNCPLHTRTKLYQVLSILEQIRD